MVSHAAPVPYFAIVHVLIDLAAMAAYLIPS